MSIISNVHTVVDYDTKKSSAFNGQRLSKITYKTDKESGVKKQSKCVSVPIITGEQVLESLVILSPAITEYLSSVQDTMVRARIDAGASEITDADISLTAIAGFLESESTGGRLTKEFIAGWFDTSIADSLSLALAEKLGIGDIVSEADNVKITASIAAYRDKLSALAGGKTVYPAELADKLLKALSFAADGDEIAGKFVIRLEKMKQVAAADLMAL